jgi:GTP-binding protein Era
MVLLVDAAKGLDDDVERILERLTPSAHAKILVLNKVDRVADKDRLLPLIAKLSEKLTFERVFAVSALDGNGVEDLKRYLADRMPAGPWHYPEDEISDVPLRLLAAELTREKIYHYLHEELPYATTVETTDWKPFKNGSVRVEQTIYVERDSQKAIVLGKGGQTIKKISSLSRSELSKILERDVHLFLFVKVRENWGSDPERYREIGLDFPKD